MTTAKKITQDEATQLGRILLCRLLAEAHSEYVDDYEYVLASRFEGTQGDFSATWNEARGSGCLTIEHDGVEYDVWTWESAQAVKGQERQAMTVVKISDEWVIAWDGNSAAGLEIADFDAILS